MSNVKKIKLFMNTFIICIACPIGCRRANLYHDNHLKLDHIVLFHQVQFQKARSFTDIKLNSTLKSYIKTYSIDWSYFI